MPSVLGAPGQDTLLINSSSMATATRQVSLLDFNMAFLQAAAAVCASAAAADDNASTSSSVATLKMSNRVSPHNPNVSKQANEGWLLLMSTLPCSQVSGT